MFKPIIASDELQRLRQMLDDCRRVVITCHAQPDGDALGSSLAMRQWLQRRGKQADVIVPTLFPDFLRCLPHCDEVLVYERAYLRSRSLIAGADLIVVLDLNDPERLRQMAQLVTNARCRRLLIDHHEQPHTFCHLQISRPKASSTCELLFRLLQALGQLHNLDTDGATCLLAGILTDTGKLTYNSNDPEIFEIVAQIMRKGVDKDLLIRQLYNQQYESRYRLMGYVLHDKLEIIPEAHAALFALTREELSRFQYMKGDMEGVVNIPLEIRGMRVAISLREDTERDEISVSIRSVDDYSARDMAERFFNGGGHFNAAGGRLQCSMDEALRIAHEAIAYYQTASDAT